MNEPQEPSKKSLERFSIPLEPEVKQKQKRVVSEASAPTLPQYRGFNSIRDPRDLTEKLGKVGYECLPYLAIQIGLFLNVTSESKVRTLLLEGPSGCGKSFLAKSLCKITDAELMVLSCYNGMPTQNLIETPSTLALVSAMASKDVDHSTLMNLGILSRAFLKSQERPALLLIDELDKPDAAIDTFFLGPIQDGMIWLESRPPIKANPDNLIMIFTKNFNRPIDDALLRRCHPIKMTYLDSTLETKILSEFCHPQLVKNLVGVADRMRHTGGTYGFERPPAPEELLLAGHYIMRLLSWGITDFAAVADSVWAIIAKSEHDRAVLEHMMRFHPDFIDPLVPDAKNAPRREILARFGRTILEGIIEDPDAERRARAWEEEQM
jgi:energy-coupling factor transporter ATP-binding protein EcfA2